MELKWLGGRAVRLSGQRGRVIMDGPVEQLPQRERGLLTVSRATGLTTGRGPDGNFILASPGEYEVDEVFAIGIASGGVDQPETLFNVNIEGVNVLHAGAAAHRPSQIQVDELGAVDVLVLPLDGITASTAQEWMGLLQPAIVVPLADGADAAERLRRFLDAVGASATEPRAQLLVQAGNLPEDTQVVVLDATA